MFLILEVEVWIRLCGLLISILYQCHQVVGEFGQLGSKLGRHDKLVEVASRGCLLSPLRAVGRSLSYGTQPVQRVDGQTSYDLDQPRGHSRIWDFMCYVSDLLV